MKKRKHTRSYAKLESSIDDEKNAKTPRNLRIRITRQCMCNAACSGTSELSNGGRENPNKQRRRENFTFVRCKFCFVREILVFALPFSLLHLFREKRGGKARMRWFPEPRVLKRFCVGTVIARTVPWTTL